MIHEFSEENLKIIGEILGARIKKTGDVYRFELVNEENNRKLALEMHVDLKVDGKTMHMISVYSQNTFLQLQNCTGFVASDILNQVTFFGKSDNRTSGLIVEKEAGCSFYANVSEDLLKGDFTRQPQEVMMSSVALSLTDSIDSEGFKFDSDT